MKERILETADKLFYLQGIRAIGVDTIAAEIGISKRTLYNHFPSKDALIKAYLERRFVHASPSDKPPAEQILATFDSLERRFAAKDFRGCPFVNAVAELGPEDRAVKKLVTGQPVAFTGYLRFPEVSGWLTPAENRGKRLWFVRDHLAIAGALGWGAVAPFYVDLEQPAPENGIPRPGPLDVHLKDDHLQYAITWFTLAGAVLIAFGAWVKARRSA